MKKTIFALLTALALLTQPVLAMDRIQWYAGSNPPSPWQNQEERDTRIGMGQLIYTLLGSTNGFFNNLTTSPVTGLFVATGPTTTGTVGSLYQYLPEEATAVGGYPSGTGPLALPADNTKVFLQGLATAASPSIGPLSPPVTSGQSINYLIECQVATVDNTPYNISLVTSAGSITQVGVNETRSDTISCKSKAGTAAPTGTQTTPTVDTGWVAISFVAVPQGTVTITSGMITNFAPFSGFGGFNASVALQATTPGTQQTGNSNISGSAVSGTVQVNGAGSLTSSGSNVVEKSTAGTTNVTFTDGGGVTLNRGSLTLTNPLTIGNGGTGQTSIPSGGCMSYNGSAIVSVNCATTGGSGVSSATLPVVFSGGIISCPTCVILQNGASMQSQGPWVSFGQFGPNARADISGDIGTGISASSGRVFFGSSNAIDYGVTTAGTFTLNADTTVSGTATASSFVSTGFNPAFSFPNGLTGSVSSIGQNAAVSVAGVVCSEFYISSVTTTDICGDGTGSVGINNSLVAVGNIGSTTGAITVPGGAMFSNSSELAFHSNSTSGGYFSDSTNSTALWGWDNAGNLTVHNNSVYVVPLYTAAGGSFGSNTHTVVGQLQTTISGSCAQTAPCTLSNATQSLSGGAAFTQSGGYCVASNADINSQIIIGIQASAATSSVSFTAYNPAGGTVAGGTVININFNCTGS